MKNWKVFSPKWISKSPTQTHVHSSIVKTQILHSFPPCNDLGLFCNLKKEITAIKSKFLKHIKIKDLGEIKTILGIKVTCNHEKCTISLSHQQYIINMVKEHNQTNSKPVYTPMEMETHLSQVELPQTPEEINAMYSIPYQNLIGTLNHAAVMTQPDILKAVQSVAQFSLNPGMKHWNVALWTVKYHNKGLGTHTWGQAWIQSPNFHFILWCQPY